LHLPCFVVTPQPYRALNPAARLVLVKAPHTKHLPHLSIVSEPAPPPFAMLQICRDHFPRVLPLLHPLGRPHRDDGPPMRPRKPAHQPPEPALSSSSVTSSSAGAARSEDRQPRPAPLRRLQQLVDPPTHLFSGVRRRPPGSLAQHGVEQPHVVLLHRVSR
jgi:hypothetical protein